MMHDWFSVVPRRVSLMVGNCFGRRQGTAAAREGLGSCGFSSGVPLAPDVSEPSSSLAA